MDDLKDVLNTAWALLDRSAQAHDGPLRMAQLATMGRGSGPRLRTVVLRGADPEGRMIRIHTDRRSAKIAEIGANPAVSVLCYDRPGGLQIRMEGRALVSAGGARAAAFWRAAHPGTKPGYRAPYAPGTPMRDPHDANPPQDRDDDGTDDGGTDGDGTDGFGNFAVIEVNVTRLDWLCLSGPAHRRAVFDWRDRAWQGTWVSP